MSTSILDSFLESVKTKINNNEIATTGSAGAPKGHKYFNEDIESARKPDFDNFKKRKMVTMSFSPYKETDDFLDESQLAKRHAEQTTFKQLLDALHASGYKVSYMPDRPNATHPLNTILENHDIVKFVVVPFAKALPPKRRRDIDVISNEMVEIAAWRMGAVRDGTGLYINTMSGGGKSLQGAIVANFLGQDCKSPTEMAITYSDSGAETSDSINYSLKEYNTDSIIKYGEAFHIPVFNFKNGSSLMRLIRTLKGENAKPTADVVEEIAPGEDFGTVDESTTDTPATPADTPAVETPTPVEPTAVTEDSDIDF